MANDQSPLRVCFVCKYAHPLFDATDHSPIGGAETHAFTLARTLTDRSGLQVSFLVEAPRLFRRKVVGGITVINSGDGFDRWRYAVSQQVEVMRRFPWLRINHWHWSLLWRLPILTALRVFRRRHIDPLTPSPFASRVNADVYCCFGVSAYTAGVIAAAVADSRRSVLFLMSNSELNPEYQPSSDYVTPHGERGDVCRYVLDHAELIVAQHEQQQRMLRETFGRESLILPNPIDLTEWDRLASRPSPTLSRLGLDRFVLWIGRADDFHKRPKLAFQLAQRLPDIDFLMLLNPWDIDLARELAESRPPNVTIVESIPFSEMPALFARSAAYCSTGSAEYEGAPNVFIQAAAARAPVISLDVSAPVIQDGGGGFVAHGNLDRLAVQVENCWNDPEAARRIGDAGRNYVEQHHTAPAIADQLLRRLMQP